MKQGEIYWVNLDPTVGHEQSKARPCIILQTNILNRYSQTTIVAPITSKYPDKEYPNIVFLELHNTGLTKQSVLKVDQVRCVDKSRIKEYLGKVSDTTLNKIKQSIRSVFDLDI
jgi:mRNA interferase MazF